MSVQRDKGTKFETWCVRFMEDLWCQIKRTGSRAQDRGDIEGAISFTIECKCWKRWSDKDVAKWFGQAEASRKREHKPWKIVWASLHGRNNKKSVIMMEADEWHQLCERYGIE